VVATALGDDTPRRYGRLSLNPFRHVQPTVMVIIALIGIGWGSTPVTPSQLRPNPKLGNAIVAAAGPLSNLALAILLSVAARMLIDDQPTVARFLIIAASLNILLFVFNLLPIPPLDGFSVLLGAVPEHIARVLRKYEHAGMGILMVLFMLPFLIRVDPIGIVIFPAARWIGRLVGLPALSF
jgi:Zn-dependent protease